MTTADRPRNPDDYCYRHPDRQSFVLCQRCLRTICADCQTQGPVGVVCPECMKEQRKSRTPAQRRAERRWRGGGAVAIAGGRPRVMAWIAGITAVAYLLQMVDGYGFGGAIGVQQWLAFYAPTLYPELTGTTQPWRLVTVALVHGGFWHVGLNLLSLWMIGRILEPIIGSGRFLALYVLSTIGGSVAVALLAFSTPVVGASGAVFGLLGTLLVIGRRLGGDIRGILVVLGINLVIGFIPGFNVSWQAHVGGLITGLVVGLVLARTSGRNRRGLQIALLSLVGVALLVLLAVPPVLGYPSLT
ncbi:rhomboid family intramembrane serine protease [Microbacterium barkeri]|uniref:rhomboid family intramembrane serine protease n=1 Tax=Microbacterium barkeri TaxID=33917 RepID=UPI0024AF5FE8|nr:rhomboid family intramembrane serine protease [Microbacterium barkeri]MDI6942774.1 rhomboid family intramembrane serine protease [Microbacterium barkeri]